MTTSMATFAIGILIGLISFPVIALWFSWLLDAYKYHKQKRQAERIKQRLGDVVKKVKEQPRQVDNEQVQRAARQSGKTAHSFAELRQMLEDSAHEWDKPEPTTDHGENFDTLAGHIKELHILPLIEIHNDLCSWTGFVHGLVEDEDIVEPDWLEELQQLHDVAAQAIKDYPEDDLPPHLAKAIHQ